MDDFFLEFDLRAVWVVDACAGLCLICKGGCFIQILGQLCHRLA
uniref:Uncharacterized protein n=1 Tax=Arundo donax TaxID=35708 RepID=A0A0A9BIX0_ARUDO